MQIKKLGKTILAIKNVYTNKVRLLEYRDYDSAIRAIESLVRSEPEGLEFYLSEKKEKGPKRKQWKSWLS